MTLGNDYYHAGSSRTANRINQRSPYSWFKTALFLLHTNVLLLQHQGHHLPELPPVAIRTPHIVRRTRRKRQRLRFSDSPEMERHSRRHGPCSEYQAFTGSLRELIPASRPRLGQKTVTRTHAQRHRHRWHKRHRKRLAKLR